VKKQMVFGAFPCIVVLALAGTGCRPGGGPRSSKTVCVYTSVDKIFAEPICDKFRKETGIEVLLVTDTEETKSTGLLNRLIAERNRPQADVFWSGDPVRAAVLKLKGIAAPYKSPQAKGLPPQYSDPEGYWTGFSARARVMIYNKNLVPEGSKPRSVFDLADPRFRGKAAIANPLFGTTSMHAAALFLALGEKKAEAFFRSLTENKVAVLSSNGEVRRRVAAGEYAIGLTDTDDAHVAIVEGKPIGVVYPDADGMGTLIVPNAVVLIGGGPHPEAGKRFTDFLLRPETELALAESEAAQMPLRPGLKIPEGMTPVSALRPMQVDYGKLAAKLEELLQGFLKKWVEESR